MKKHLFISLILIFISIFSYCQNNKIDNLSKYVGTYHLKQLKKDSIITYDYITFFIKNNKLYCSRDYSFASGSFEPQKSNEKSTPYHNDYEVISIDLKTEIIILKYMTNQCAYKFRKNIKGNLELVINEDILVYEKR